MKPATVIIFTIFSFCILAFRQASNSSDFKTKTETFLQKYSVNYSLITETLDASGFQWQLDNNTKHSWTKKQTIKGKKSFINKYNQRSYQRLFLAFYQYDSEKNCNLALDSLTKNFPVECCLDLKVGENVRSLRTIPSIYIFNKTEIITCHIHCEQLQDNWTSIQQDLINIFGNEQSTIMTTGCGGPLEWKRKN